jgi:hypothetical protein
MDTDQVRSFAQAHGEAVVRGDMDAIFADIAPDVQEAFRATGPPPGLPKVVTAAHAAEVEADGDSAVAAIVYTGDDGRVVTVRSRWEPRGERPMITEIVSVEG